LLDSPTVPPCDSGGFGSDPLCIPYPNMVDPYYGGSYIPPIGNPYYDDENFAEALITCAARTTTSSTTRVATSTKSIDTPFPEPSPLAQGNPQGNKMKRCGKGENTEHARVISSSTSFCNSIAKDVLTENYFKKWTFPSTIMVALV